MSRKNLAMMAVIAGYWDFLDPWDYPTHPKGPTPNKYKPHQGEKERKRRLKQSTTPNNERRD